MKPYIIATNRIINDPIFKAILENHKITLYNPEPIDQQTTKCYIKPCNALPDNATGQVTIQFSASGTENGSGSSTMIKIVTT